MALSSPSTSEAPAGLFAAYLCDRDDLVRMLSARLGSREAAEDVVQDLYCRLAALSGGQDVANPSAYLRILARNLMLDRLRSEARAVRRDDHWRAAHVETMHGEAIAAAPSAERTVETRERLRRLLALVERLPSRSARAFRLHKLHGLSQAETAQRMGISRSAVEKHIMSALRTLAEGLE